MLKDMLYTGLGMGTVLKEKVENEIQKFEDKEKLSTRGKEEEKRIKELFKKNVKEVLDELGIATKEDIKNLKDELSKK